jgi:hypothetical protein
MGKKNAGSKIWTEDDDNFLKENYGKLKAKDFSKILGRTESAVYSRIYDLELAKTKEKGNAGDPPEVELLPFYEEIKTEDQPIQEEKSTLIIGIQALEKGYNDAIEENKQLKLMLNNLQIAFDQIKTMIN